MKLEHIRVVTNGFIVETVNGETYIAKTLTEVVQLAGEFIPSLSTTTYDCGMNASHLSAVKSLAQQGYKIDAIKKLRDCFVPRLGLREAKDLVEQLCF